MSSADTFLTIRSDAASLLSKALRIASAFKAEIHQEYEDDKALITVSVRSSDVEKLKADLLDATGGAVLFK